ncbi:hypothetical protein [Chryseobacterium piperi]|uniref:hypothetical protein n=1 Tax=Chryseobacterium piperi TaxID=558152 RepID=UPI0010389BB6|nr:hypothetical protein [Chryseobacterium piperi]
MRQFLYPLLLRSSQYARLHLKSDEPYYKYFLQMERYAPTFRYVDTIVSPTGRVGSPLMEPFRIFGRWLGWKFCYAEHDFEFNVLVGPVSPYLTARSVFEFSKNSIGRTVPGAMRGGDGELMGVRTNDAVTTAVFGGQVRTTHNDETMTMRNFAEPGHVFSGGYLDLAFIEKDGNVYINLRGGGYNNFASLNQVFGSWLFPDMARSNAAAYRAYKNLPRIKHTVENLPPKKKELPYKE